MIKAVIFDFNGVIVDDIPLQKKAWKALCEKHGCKYSDQLFNEKISGRITAEVWAFLLDRELGKEEKTRLLKEKTEVYFSLAKDGAKPLPGLIDFLQDLRKNGFLTAIATSGMTTAPRVMQEMGIQQFFDVILSAADINKGKPHPEIYLKTAEKLGVKPSECVVFEDALLGVESARNAGMKCVGVATSHEKLEGTEFMIKDFTEISVERVRGL